MKIRFEFVPRDLWVGAFWKVGGENRSYVAGTAEYRVYQQVDLWVCVLPMLPIHFVWERRTA